MNDFVLINNRNQRYNQQYNEIDTKSSLGDLLNRYVCLGRQMGKTHNMLKMVHSRGLYIFVLHNRHIFSLILNAFRRDYDATDEDLKYLKGNSIIFCPYIYGNSFFDQKVLMEYEEIQRKYPDHKVLIDNAVIDIETENIIKRMLNLTKATGE